ncbi:MAG: hypothetical protein EB116_01455 [Betaproteobacteria bacterium]|nr:hypothetical protein [Betaproteobacteria bacterium]
MRQAKAILLASLVAMHAAGPAQAQDAARVLSRRLRAVIWEQLPRSARLVTRKPSRRPLLRPCQRPLHHQAMLHRAVPCLRHLPSSVRAARHLKPASRATPLFTSMPAGNTALS